MADATAWSVPVRLQTVRQSAPVLTLQADAAVRDRIARLLGLVRLDAFSAEVRLKPWFDGAEIDARWSATVAQTCGVSLEEFETVLERTFLVRAVPPESKLATPPEGEAELDLEAEDPPDVMEGDVVDVGALLIEHLSLEIDPFPRKPGVEFEPPQAGPSISPFAVLQGLKRGETPGE